MPVNIDINKQTTINILCKELMELCCLPTAMAEIYSNIY